MNAVTISGDHMAGKTETLIDIALRDATLKRKRVLYVTYDTGTALNTMDRALNGTVLLDRVARQSRRAGGYRIEFEHGGRIHFLSQRSNGGARGLSVDTLILDEFDQYANPNELEIVATTCLIGSDDPRIYKTRCTSE